MLMSAKSSFCGSDSQSSRSVARSDRRGCTVVGVDGTGDVNGNRRTSTRRSSRCWTRRSRTLSRTPTPRSTCSRRTCRRPSSRYRRVRRAAAARVQPRIGSFASQVTALEGLQRWPAVADACTSVLPPVLMGKAPAYQLRGACHPCRLFRNALPSVPCPLLIAAAHRVLQRGRRVPCIWTWCCDCHKPTGVKGRSRGLFRSD